MDPMDKSPFSNWPEMPEDDETPIDRESSELLSDDLNGEEPMMLFQPVGDDIMILPMKPSEEADFLELLGQVNPEDIAEPIQKFLDALKEPFPNRPFALLPAGGDRTPEHMDFVIHKDVQSEHQCVFLFESIVDAFSVAEEYKNETEKEAEPTEADIHYLDEDRFWVRFYRANGVYMDCSIPDYIRHMSLSRDY